MALDICPAQPYTYGLFIDSVLYKYVLRVYHWLIHPYGPLRSKRPFKGGSLL
jgi:hypothetical protein